MSADRISRSGIVAAVITIQLGMIVWLAFALHYSHKAWNNQKELNADFLKALQHRDLIFLSLKDVKEWRIKYAYMLDSYRDLAIEKWGPPTKEDKLPNDKRSILLWQPSEKTDGRTVSLELYGDRIKGVTVDPKITEVLDLVAAMQEAKDFTFKSDVISIDLPSGFTTDGTAERSIPEQQFLLVKNDGSMVLTYRIGSDSLDFDSVEFR